MAFTSSANGASNGEPHWLADLGQALDALPSLAPANEAPAVPSGHEVQDGFEVHPGAGRLVAVGTAEVYDSVPPLKLTHKEVQDYGASMSRAVKTAQLDDRFVSPKYLERAFTGLSALGMMPREQRVQLHGETGMPTYVSWAQVHAQRDLARHFRADDPRYTKLHLSTPMSAHVRDLLKDIPDSPLTSDARIEVVEVDGQTRRFRVHLDAWRDPGFVVRTTLHIDPSKATSVDVAPMTQDASGAWAMNRELNAMVGSLAKQGASHLALIVSRHCGQALTGVTQGIVGPVYFSGAVMPDPIADVFDALPDNLIACFTAFELWREPREVTNPAWVDPDDAPLERLIAQGWSAEVDKLWVCTPELRSALEFYAEKYDTTLKVRSTFF
ncbi:MAG: hypothetical protein ACAI38_25140 [Myxococcota bacterium]